LREVVEPDAVRARVGEGRVGGAAAAELGVQLDHVARRRPRHERRATLGGRQCARVLLGLAAGAQHGVVEAARMGAGLQALGFQHEGAAPVAVDAAFRGAAVAVGEHDAALEHVCVVLRVGA
jgi:hypothetical protein